MPRHLHLPACLIALALPSLAAPSALRGQASEPSEPSPPRPPYLEAGKPEEIDPATRADRLYSRGELTEAAAVYRAALGLGSAAADAAVRQRNRFLLACLLFELGSFADARKEFETVHQENDKARASEMLARLCVRRIAQPAEPVGDAIEAVIVPFLLERNPGAIAWNDPVMEGLVGETLLRSGPMFPAPSAIGLLIEENIDDPAILLGGSRFLARSHRTGLLEIARKKFPQSPSLQMATFFSLRFTQSSAARTQALEALGATILADPDNAFPRYLRLGVEHYETRRDPATGTLAPYSTKILAEFERCNGLEKFDAYAGESDAAASRVLRELSHPFRISLIQSHVESGLVLNNILQHLSATAKALLEGADLEAARRVRGISETVARRWNATANASSIRAMTAANASVMLAHFARYHEARGETDAVAEIAQRQREYQAIALGDAADTLWPSIAIIPIPAISNHAVGRLGAMD